MMMKAKRTINKINLTNFYLNIWFDIR